MAHNRKVKGIGTPKGLKVLVATRRSQGSRADDFFFTNEGELVRFGLICSRDIGKGGLGGCGCGRSMVGFETLKATTTFEVIHSSITKGEYLSKDISSPLEFLDRYVESHFKSGFPPMEAQLVIEDVNELLRIARLYPVGTLLGIRENDIILRVLLKKNKRNTR